MFAAKDLLRIASENRIDDDMSWHECSSVDGPVGRHSFPLERHEAAQEETSQSYVSISLQSLWNSYGSHVRRHQMTLQLIDDLLTRAVFWTPPSSHDISNKSRWRQVMYGLISLHRLVMDLAITQDQLVNSYGTTLQPTVSPAPVPATALRIALTVTHNLMPTILELARFNPQGQATCRLWLERVKFVTRLMLVSAYWRQIRGEPYEVVGGLLQDGGMYHVGMQLPAPTVANAQALKFRREYIGRRTGRRVIAGEGGSRTEQQNRILWLRLMLGELLRLYRPLYWAQAERDNIASGGSTQQLLKAWCLTLAMEVTSLQCLSGAVSRDNPLSQRELSRRRMKVLLYMLRSPAWERTTEPVIVQTASILRRVPLLGRLVETYLWEFILFWKHPFVSEEE